MLDLKVCWCFGTSRIIKLTISDVGASKGALNVLSDVAADFMMNLGRTLRFYSDKYGQTMSAEVRLSVRYWCSD